MSSDSNSPTWVAELPGDVPVSISRPSEPQELDSRPRSWQGLSNSAGDARNRGSVLSPSAGEAPRWQWTVSPDPSASHPGEAGQTAGVWNEQSRDFRSSRLSDIDQLERQIARLSSENAELRRSLSTNDINARQPPRPGADFSPMVGKPDGSESATQVQEDEQSTDELNDVQRLARPAVPAPVRGGRSGVQDPPEPWTFCKPVNGSRPLLPQESRAICAQCQLEKANVAFCPACGIQFCREHWAAQFVHRGPHLGSGLPHEKIDPQLAGRIKSIIEPSITADEQRTLHQADGETTWFGVFPNEMNKLLFYDYRRYEKFLDQSPFGPKSNQFPSLVSFVGPTGAGKSTVVKALIELAVGSRGAHAQRTPVVGLLENQAVPTSGEVHLYWDPMSLLSPRPLLYADCEGLGGGSREPMAARATAVEEKKSAPKDRREAWRRQVSESQISAYQSTSRPASLPYSSMSPRTVPLPRSAGTPRHVVDELQTHSSVSSYSPFSPVDEMADSPQGWHSTSEKVYQGVTREVAWAIDRQKRSRQFIVENLYPRILYTFSDVVVLVMRNPKQLEMEIQRLIGWAATAFEKSSNQPMLPFAIIVVNAVDAQTGEDLLDVPVATYKLLEDLKDTVDSNDAFARLADHWRDNHRPIHSTRDLLLAYYTDVKIVFIPEKGRPRLVYEQYEKLYFAIQDAVARSEGMRHKAGLRLSSDELNSYLQLAFDHFSRTLEEPFDFVKASSRLNQTQSQFNPILCLIKEFRAAWPERGVGQIFEEVSYLVASAIMLDVVRRHLIGTPEDMFPTYLETFKDAVKKFFEEAWPCEAIHSRLHERCIIVKPRHDSKGHQLANGKVWSGKYVSRLDEDHEPAFTDGVFKKFKSLYSMLLERERKAGISGLSQRLMIAFDIHQEQVIREQCTFMRDRKAIINHRVCLCCLFQVPVQSLLCGHIICNACFGAAGAQVREHVAQLQCCPICGVTWSDGKANVEVIQKPLNCGLRVLTLDGGGVRALTQLIILDMIEQRIGLKIPIQAFFDLVVGTSGGGIVALALGEKNMTVSEATDMFKRFAGQAFGRGNLRTGANVPLWGSIVQLKYHSRYKSRGLERPLQEAFGHELLFGGRRHLQSLARCKVAVTATDTNSHAVLLANYNRYTRIPTPYHFQRFEKPDQELRIWEAARATSAAPGYFKGFYHPVNGYTYQDGALKLNNPVLAADYERRILWPDCAARLPDILLSIGTGYFPAVSPPTDEPPPRIGIGVVNGIMTFVKIAQGAVENELDCEKTWDEFVQCTNDNSLGASKRLHRLTVPFRGGKIDLDAANKLDELESGTRAYFKMNSRQIDEIAAQLLASLFYFDVTTRLRNRITGMIRCRLPEDIVAQGSLQKLAKGLRKLRHNARQFRIYPSVNSSDWIPAIIDDGHLREVENRRTVFGVPVTFDITDATVPSKIYFDIPGFMPQTISGFPRCVVGPESPGGTPLLPHRTLSNPNPPRSSAQLSPSSANVEQPNSPPFDRAAWDEHVAAAWDRR